MSKTKTTKRTVRFFSVVDWQKEEEYLRDMHKKGWKFVSYGWSGFLFEKCEPEDVVYQLDFKTDDKNTDEYLQMFKDCGWEYLQDFGGYSYFRKPASEMKENEEGIFCDDESRLEMLKNVYRKRVMPLVTIFFLVIIPQLVGQTMRARDTGEVFCLILSVAFLILLVLYLVIFISFGLTLRKFKRNIRK